MLAGLGRALRSGKRQLPVLLGRRDGCPPPPAPQVRPGGGEDPRGTAAGRGGVAPRGCWSLARLCPGVRRGRGETELGASVTRAGLGPRRLRGSAAALACPGPCPRGAVTHGRRSGSAGRAGGCAPVTHGLLCKQPGVKRECKKKKFRLLLLLPCT